MCVVVANPRRLSLSPLSTHLWWINRMNPHKKWAREPRQTDSVDVFALPAAANYLRHWLDRVKGAPTQAPAASTAAAAASAAAHAGPGTVCLFVISLKDHKRRVRVGKVSKRFLTQSCSSAAAAVAAAAVPKSRADAAMKMRARGKGN